VTGGLESSLGEKRGLGITPRLLACLFFRCMCMALISPPQDALSTMKLSDLQSINRGYPTIDHGADTSTRGRYNNRGIDIGTRRSEREESYARVRGEGRCRNINPIN
jgi:hypothetical protein